VSLFDALILFAAALGAGIFNSICGGGRFLSFPVLLLTGVLPIQASATNTLAVWPGIIAGTIGYRREVAAHRHLLPVLTVVGVIGGFAGAKILLHTSQATFFRIIPWLLLGGTIVFLFGVPLARWIRQRTLLHPRVSFVTRAVTVALLFLISIYIGYFGAGVAILVAAVFALMGLENMHAINGLRTYLVSVSNVVAVATFIMAGAIAWPQALVMVFGTAIGGYSGARFARRLDSSLIRGVVITLGFVMSVYFFFRAY
jgi:uncharacterized protein